MNELIIVFCTTSSKDEAKIIAREMVQKRLAACVNIIDKVTSVFEWEGKLNEESEALMIVKTKKALFTDLKEAIIKLHSYKVPEIISVPINDGLDSYLDWISGNTI